MEDLDQHEIPLKLANSFPEAFRKLKSHTDIRSAFPSPTLLTLEGESSETVFLSVLLHGNEPTSFYVLKEIYNSYRSKAPKRTIKIFIGNVYAAEKDKRFLDGQDDFNRIWLEPNDRELTPGETLAKKVKSLLPEDLYATIDIHNNTGNNPMYACVSQLLPSHIYLGSLYSRTMVYFVNPRTALTRNLSETCPSVTLECGKIQGDFGAEKAFRFFEDVLNSKTLEHNTKNTDVDIYQATARLLIDDKVNYSFSNEDADLQITERFDRLNFSELSQGTSIAKWTASSTSPIRAVNDDNMDVTDTYLTLSEGEIKLNTSVTPAMLTTDKEIVAKDCLGYLMRKIDFDFST